MRYTLTAFLPLLLVSCGYSKTAYVPQPERFRSTDEAVEVIRYGMTNNTPYIKRVTVNDHRITFIYNDKPYDYRYADIEDTQFYERKGISRVQTSGILEPFDVYIRFTSAQAIIRFAEKGDAIRFMDALEYMRAHTD